MKPASIRTRYDFYHKNLSFDRIRIIFLNYLLAKRNNGEFILRTYIEEGEYNDALDHLKNSLLWCNLIPDECFFCGSKLIPNSGSARNSLYKGYIQKLIDNGNAYYAFDNLRELDRIKKERQSAYFYDSTVRLKMKNSLTLNKEKVHSLLKSKHPYVIRFKVPENKAIKAYDIFNGEINATGYLDDFIIWHFNDEPDFCFARSIDDYEMGITHIINHVHVATGELLDIIKESLLFDALGWESFLPQFGHVCYMKMEDDSWFHIDNLNSIEAMIYPIEWNNPNTGNTMFGFKENGFLPDAFINILGDLSIKNKKKQEIYHLQELINNFSIEAIRAFDVEFSFEKAKWINQQYIQQLQKEEILKHFKPILEAKDACLEDNELIKIFHLVKNRMNSLTDFWEQSYYFFHTPTIYDFKSLKAHWDENPSKILKGILSAIDELDDFSSEGIQNSIIKYKTETEISYNTILDLIRLSLVGKIFGIDIFLIIELIGKEETKTRIMNAIKKIKLYELIK